MLLSDLENWKNYKKNPKQRCSRQTNHDNEVRDGNARVYQAQEDFSSMIVSVLQIREQGLISSTLHSLQEAKKHACNKQQTANKNLCKR